MVSQSPCTDTYTTDIMFSHVLSSICLSILRLSSGEIISQLFFFLTFVFLSCFYCLPTFLLQLEKSEANYILNKMPFKLIIVQL